MRVIGAGIGRTGTSSLKLALEQLLQGSCHHMTEVFQHPEQISVWHQASQGESVDWKELLHGYKAGVDWPISAFAAELSQLYPDALILLSERDFDSWWKSANGTIFPAILSAEGPWRDMIEALLRNRFTFKLQDKEAVRKAFEKHYAKMIDEIPSERILRWRTGDGWAPICERLGIDIPEEDFPHSNTTAEFQSRMEQ